MARPEVEAAVQAYLTANPVGVPIRYPDSTDSDGSQTPGDGSSFIEVQFPVATSVHVGIAQIGNRTFRETGVIRLVLASQRGLGKVAALATCTTLLALFLAKQFGGVTTRTPNSSPSADGNDNGVYYLRTITIPYFFDYLG